MASRRRSDWCEIDSDGEWQCSMVRDDEEPCTSVCSRASRRSTLSWDYASLERIVLMLADRFGFRIEMNSAVRGVGASALVPAGLALVGGALGRHLGGRTGAALGGAIGGVVGVGVILVTLRDVWESIKAKLPELLDIVFDYLGNLGLEDYKAAIQWLTSSENEHAAQLAHIILQVVRDVLGKNVLSTLPMA